MGINLSILKDKHFFLMYSSSLFILIDNELAKISEYFLIYKIINLFSRSKGKGKGIL